MTEETPELHSGLTCGVIVINVEPQVTLMARVRRLTADITETVVRIELGLNFIGIKPVGACTLPQVVPCDLPGLPDCAVLDP